jgi:hypothetical protein
MRPLDNPDKMVLCYKYQNNERLTAPTRMRAFLCLFPRFAAFLP